MATKWGIASVGKISKDYVCALKTLPREEHALVAVAARDKARAKAFAEEHGFQKSYGSYEAMAKDPDVEIVYVGNLNPGHYSVSKLFLENGKNVLCEKPMCMNKREVTSLLDLARSKNVFLMEGVWSRFFPAYEYIRQELKAGTIGDIVQVNASHGSAMSQKDRISQKELGGGTILDLGVYVLQLVNLAFGGESPQIVKAVGHLSPEGVDLNMAATLTYTGNRTAVLSTQSLCKTINDAYIYGTKGYIKVPDTFWCPTRVILNGDEKEFPLPKSQYEFRHTNSVGFTYEAAEVRRCLNAGLKESPLMPHNTSLWLAEMEDEIRKQIGVVFPQDE